jgi:enoyl-CoA hydratase/carnithine racemase
MMATTTHPHLLVEQTDKICWITFNRPERQNCFSDDML